MVNSGNDFYLPEDPIAYDEAPEKKRRRVKSLTDVWHKENKTFTAAIEVQDEILEFEMRRLSHNEWLSYEREPFVEKIIPPQVAVAPNKQGRRMIFDYEHPDYKAKTAEQANRVVLLRVAAALITEVPGKDIPDKADWLSENAPIGLVGNLYRVLALESVNLGVELEVEADTFQ